MPQDNPGPDDGPDDAVQFTDWKHYDASETDTGGDRNRQTN